MNIETIVFHHTATQGLGNGEQEWNAIISLCKQRRGSTYICDYHYGIGPSGKLFLGQSILYPCWHCGDDSINTSSLAVACIGNFEEHLMPLLQKSRLRALIQELKSRYPNARMLPHKDIVATLCPGKNYPYEELTKVPIQKLRFSDVEKTNIFYPAIEMIVKKGIMSGDKEGTFRPSESVTRGELAQVFANFLKLEDIN